MSEAQYATRPTSTQAQFHAQYKAAQERMRAAARRHKDPPAPMPESQAITSLRREIEIRDAKIRELEHRLKPKVHVSAHWHSLGGIERRICRVFGITRIELHAQRRDRQSTLARFAFYYWACRLTAKSLTEIARYSHGRDHTSILNGRNMYPARRAKMGRNLRPVK